MIERCPDTLDMFPDPYLEFMETLAYLDQKDKAPPERGSDLAGETAGFSLESP